MSNPTSSSTGNPAPDPTPDASLDAALRDELQDQVLQLSQVFASPENKAAYQKEVDRQEAQRLRLQKEKEQELRGKPHNPLENLFADILAGVLTYATWGVLGLLLVGVVGGGAWVLLSLRTAPDVLTPVGDLTRLAQEGKQGSPQSGSGQPGKPAGSPSQGSGARPGAGNPAGAQAGGKPGETRQGEAGGNGAKPGAKAAAGGSPSQQDLKKLEQALASLKEGGKNPDPKQRAALEKQLREARAQAKKTAQEAREPGSTSTPGAPKASAQQPGTPKAGAPQSAAAKPPASAPKPGQAGTAEKEKSGSGESGAEGAAGPKAAPKAGEKATQSAQKMASAPKSGAKNPGQSPAPKPASVAPAQDQPQASNPAPKSTAKAGSTKATPTKATPTGTGKKPPRKLPYIRPDLMPRLRQLWLQGKQAKHRGDYEGARRAWGEAVRLVPGHYGFQESIDKLPPRKP